MLVLERVVLDSIVVVCKMDPSPRMQSWQMKVLLGICCTKCTNPGGETQYTGHFQEAPVFWGISVWRKKQVRKDMAKCHHSINLPTVLLWKKSPQAWGFFQWYVRSQNLFDEKPPAKSSWLGLGTWQKCHSFSINNFFISRNLTKLLVVCILLNTFFGLRHHRIHATDTWTTSWQQPDSTDFNGTEVYFRCLLGAMYACARWGAGVPTSGLRCRELKMVVFPQCGGGAFFLRAKKWDFFKGWQRPWPQNKHQIFKVAKKKTCFIFDPRGPPSKGLNFGNRFKLLVVAECRGWNAIQFYKPLQGSHS